MNSTDMLHQMCQETLSPVDIRAICKSRGFTDREATSKVLFENAFLSSTGVEAALKTLTAAEIATLHLLYLGNRAVDIAFFDRLYGSKQAGFQTYGTFTQQFKPIYDAVLRNLVRKGLLIIAEAQSSALNKPKMELWRFCFPPDFAPYLPSLFSTNANASIKTDQPGVFQPDKFRLELGRSVQTTGHEFSDVQLVAGSIVVNKKPFKAAYVPQWQQHLWQETIERAVLKLEFDKAIARSNLYVPYLSANRESSDVQKQTPILAIRYALVKLAADEWIVPEELDTLLDIVYGGPDHPTAAAIFQMGWECNCLIRYQANGLDYYRLINEQDHSTAMPLERCLPVESGSIFVDLAEVSYKTLENINSMVTFAIQTGRLKIVPNMVKLIDSLNENRDQVLTDYLQKHDPDFRSLFKKINTQWGKLIIHDNLLVARITDLSLRVKLQKTFEAATGASSANWIILQDEYVVFPRAMLAEVEKLVKKSGHVIKTIQAQQ